MSDPQVVEKEVVEAPQSDQEASAALAAGYNKVKGLPAENAPANTETVDKTADSDAAKATDDAKKAADEAAAKAAAENVEEARERAYLESLPASVKAKLDKIDRIEATANQIGAAQRKLKTVEDRVEAIGRAGTAAAKAATAAGAAAPTKEQIDAAAAVGGEKWKQIKEDFPDWAEAMEERLAALKPGSSPAVDVEAIRKEVAGDVETRIAKSADDAEERAVVRLKHPGWRATVRTPEFKGWYETQPEDVKALASSTNGDEAVKMLDAFEVHRKAAAEAAAKRDKNQARLAAAVAPKQASSGGPTVLPDEAGLAVGYNRIANLRA